MAAIVSGAAGQAAAFAVQRNLPGSDYFQDARSDASVDVILTGDYRGLVKPELVDQTPGKLECPRESRRIADDGQWPVIPTQGAKGLTASQQQREVTLRGRAGRRRRTSLRHPTG